MIKAEWLAMNSFYPDQCAGLFGFSGSHRLVFFTIFMTLYNLCISEEIAEKFKRKAFNVYIFCTTIWMLYISTLNDNKSIFVLLPFVLIVFWVIQSIDIENLKRKLSKIVSIGLYGLIVVIIATLLLHFFPSVSEFIQVQVVDSAIRLATAGRLGQHGSIERITIAMDALKEGYGLLFGDGLGAAVLSESLGAHYRGYKHFSMSSIGSLITLGGIWFYLSYCLFYTRAFCRMLNQKHFSMLKAVLVFVVIVSLTIYVPLFEIEILFFWLCLIFVLYGRDKDFVSDRQVY